MRHIAKNAFLVFAGLSAALGMGGCGSGAPGDFTLGTTSSAFFVTAGQSGQIGITETVTGTLQVPVTLAISGLPAGVTASPASFTLQPGAAQTVTLAATRTAAAGSATAILTGTSGTRTHTVTLAVNVAAAPTPPPVPPPTPTPAPAGDFTLAVTPGGQTVTAGGAQVQATLLATALNGFAGTVTVTPNGLPAGVTVTPATLTLSPGASAGIGFAAAANAQAGTATVSFTGVSGSLTHTATVALTVVPASASPAPAGPDVTTYHYDNTRQGWNAQETILTPNNVNAQQFGLLGVYPVDGKVDAAPLYAGAQTVQAGAVLVTENVVYAATEHDSVYALNPATGAQAWRTSVLGAGETPSDARNCGQVTPEIGITATPVIDRKYGPHGAIFVVGLSKDASGGYHDRLHALDLSTGAELPGSPTEIAATYLGQGVNSQNGENVFDPAQYVERVGLTLANGTIYLGWSSHCDIAPYTGWVMGYSEQTLRQTTVLNLTPNGSDGSIWMSGYGIAADANNNLFLADANGTLDAGLDANGFPSRGDYGNGILRLSTTGGLAVADYFEPYNTTAESAEDQDLGSGGAMLLPDLTDSTGRTVQLMVVAGKDSNIYVADRNNLGKFNGNGAANSNLYQEVMRAVPNGVWAGPAYFNGTVYYGGVNDVLRAFPIANAKLSGTPGSESATSFAYPGATPSVSSNGTQNGIVWALESASGAPAVLHAYDAMNLGHEFYNSKEAANGRDGFGLGNKFLTPVVVNGMVFVGTPNAVAVFGLLGQPGSPN